MKTEIKNLNEVLESMNFLMARAANKPKLAEFTRHLDDSTEKLNKVVRMLSNYGPSFAEVQRQAGEEIEKRETEGE
jgi:hypothetical protein